MLKSWLMWTGLLCIILVFVGAAGIWLLQEPSYVYRVCVDGEVVGTISELDDYTLILGALLDEAEKETGLVLSFAQEVSAYREFDWNPEPDKEQVKEEIYKLVSYVAVGWAIVIDGEAVLWVESEGAANEVIASVKQRFTSVRPANKVVSIEFTNELAIEPQVVIPESVVDVATAVNLLVQGQERVETHVVARGETLWSISRSHLVSEAQLKAANPQLGASTLQVGQTINLVSSVPLVEMKLVETRSVFEAIPFRTVERTTNRLWYFQSRTASPGASGQRELVYHVEVINGIETGRTLVETKVTREPKNRVIERGIAQWPGQATGMFRWPLNTGRITDRFGNFQSWRSSRHTGVDIGAPPGTPIYAAAAGTVIRSGWAGGYGYMVEIRHSNGYSTLYAHASRIAPAAATGRQVSKGQIIAYVGSTGSSTGPHLHFEVRQNGNPIDPLRFYAP